MLCISIEFGEERFESKEFFPKFGFNFTYYKKLIVLNLRNKIEIFTKIRCVFELKKNFI